MNSVDDRGNVVDIYVNNEHSGRIDREADPISGILTEETFSFDGGKDEIAVAMSNGYGEEVAIAIICDLLRNFEEAKETAIEYLRVAMIDSIENEDL